MIRRSSTGLVAVLALAASLLVAPTAHASTAPPKGGIDAAAQNTFTHVVTVHGWAYDPVRPAASVAVAFFVNGTYVGQAAANLASPVLVTRYGIPGNHAYTFRFSRSSVSSVTSASRGVRTGALTRLGAHPVTHYWPAPGARIITVAQRYVGTTRYAEGGSTPSTGFDCSGYTSWAYSHALVGTLPRTAEGQRRMRGMRLISAATARPGDLVFYLSGGTAFHVAIYAGNHMQYAAATARDGIRYQPVWSSAVQYRTDWH